MLNFTELIDMNELNDIGTSADTGKKEMPIELVTQVFFSVFTNVTKDSPWDEIRDTIDNNLTIEFRRKLLKYIPVLFVMQQRTLKGKKNSPELWMQPRWQAS